MEQKRDNGTTRTKNRNEECRIADEPEKVKADGGRREDSMPDKGCGGADEYP